MTTSGPTNIPVPGVPGYYSSAPIPPADQAGINAAYLSQVQAGSPGIDLFPGAVAQQGYSGVSGTTTDGGILYSIFRNGALVGTYMGNGSTDTVALASQYGVGGNFGTGFTSGGASSAPLATGASSIGASPLVGGAGGGVGSGTTIPGGTAGSLGSSGATASASALLAGLSHGTAGLNWSHLALWLAILAGAYIVLDSLVGGKRRRR